MASEDLEIVRAELASAGLPPDEVAAVRIVQSGVCIGLPYLATPTGPTAIESWRRLRGLIHSRRHPVLVDGAECPANESDQPGELVSDVVSAGEAMDVNNEWPARQSAWIDRFHSPDAKWPPRSNTDDLRGPWPAEPVARHDFVGPYWGFFRDNPTADILLPACREPWMVPAYLRVGPHNDLPDAALQCAVMRSWYRRFGAEVVYTNGCVYEFFVARPPKDRETALRLAQEHYLFCPDRVVQVCPDTHWFPTPGNDTLEALAAMLMNSTVWYFWWD